jgi:hypothetical protein
MARGLLFSRAVACNVVKNSNKGVFMKRYLLSGIFSGVLILASLAGAAPNWELLGRQEVNFREDHDRIEVGRQEGRFKQLQLKVTGGPIEMRRMTVTFANNETFTPNLRHRFEKNSWTRSIDLPGDRRTIKSIDFNYASLDRRHEPATVEVYGR